jgi:lambda repressor-like predicted transcriptional regulator
MNGTYPKRPPVSYGPLGPRSDLIEVMARKGWSTQRLSHESGVAYETCRRLLRGYIPTARVQFQVADALDLDVLVVKPLSTSMPGVRR